MSIVDVEDLREELHDTVDDLCDDVENAHTDNQGQLVIYSGVYVWSDLSLHDCPEEDLEEDADDLTDIKTGATK